MAPSLANAFAALELEDELAGNSGSASSKKKRNKKKGKGGGAGGADGGAPAAAGDAGLDEEEGEAADPDATVPPLPVDATAAASTEPLAEPIIWIDLEMTGLEVDTCAIIEIACLVTDGSLERVIEGPNLVIHHADEVLHGMNAWCVEQHGRSGLTQRVRASDVSLAAAEDAVLSFLERHTAPGCTPLAGNSVHCDLAFIKRYMPRLAAHLSWKIVDVTSVRELAKRWYPSELRRAPRKANKHTALADIRESVAELRWLRRNVFKQSK